MEDKIIQPENNETPLNEEQQQQIVSNELAIVPEAERKDIMKVVKTADIILIDTHKKKIKNFKSRFPAKKYAITEELAWNKEVYEKALEQWREVKNYRTKNAEPDFKNLKAPYVAISKYYNDATKPVIDDLKAIEAPISAFVDKMEELEKAEKKKDELAAEKKVNERRDILIAAGAVFNDGYFEAGNVALDIPLITLGEIDLKTMTDPIWENVLVQVKDKLAATAAAQKIVDDAAAKKIIDDAAEAKRIKDENDARAAEIIEMRGTLLEAIGMEVMENPAGFKFGSLAISNELIGTAAKTEWDLEYSKLKTGIAEAKKEEEQKKVLATRQKELLDLKLVWNANKQEYSLNGIAVSLHYLQTATAGGWEEAIADTKEKIAAAEKAAKQREDRHAALLENGLQEKQKHLVYSYKGNDTEVLKAIESFNDEEWETYLYDIKTWKEGIDFDIQIQKERNDKIQPFLIFGHSIDLLNLYKLDDDQWDKIFSDTRKAHAAKVAKDAQDKIDNDAAAEKAKLAKSTDGQKWEAVKMYLNNVPVVEMESPEFQLKHKQLLEYIAGLK